MTTRLTNYNRESGPGYPSLNPASDPFLSALDQLRLAPPMTEAEREAFFNPAVWPTLVAWKGYSYLNTPFHWYYWSGAEWRDTLTDEIWNGVK